MCCCVVFIDVPGTAAVIGPRTVVIGDNVTLNCSVTDPGLFVCVFDVSDSISLCLTELQLNTDATLFS